MKIERIKIKNFKVFKDVDIHGSNLSSGSRTLFDPLPNMCVFLGANGSGKSTLFDVFGFLSDALRSNVKTAINKRGGFGEVITREQTGDIEFEIKFRNDSTDGKKSPLITYKLKVGLRDGVPIVNEEMLMYRRGQSGQPWRFLDFEQGSGKAVVNEQEYGKIDAKEVREEQTLDSPDILAIKGLGQFQKFKAISDFRRLLENWFVSNFSIQASRTVQDLGVREHLSTQGENLPLVTQYLYQHHRGIFDRILEKMKQRVPGINKVEAKETEDGRIVLKFQDGAFKDPFIARYVSDGTLKMFAYLILLNDPAPHPLLCVEEPENYLHPELLPELAEEFRDYARRGGQVFISTHSPDFINALELPELFWLTKEQGYTTVKNAADDPIVKILFAEGDQLGSLWTQKFFKGSGPKSQ